MVKLSWNPVGVEKRVVLVDADVPFDLFESHIRCTGGSGSSPVKIIYFLNVRSCLFVPSCFCRRI